MDMAMSLVIVLVLCHFPMHECCLGDSGYVPIA